MERCIRWLPILIGSKCLWHFCWWIMAKLAVSSVFSPISGKGMIWWASSPLKLHLLCHIFIIVLYSPLQALVHTMNHIASLCNSHVIQCGVMFWVPSFCMGSNRTNVVRAPILEMHYNQVVWLFCTIQSYAGKCLCLGCWCCTDTHCWWQGQCDLSTMWDTCPDHEFPAPRPSVWTGAECSHL